MIEIATLRDYDSKHGYQSYLALLSTARLDCDRKRRRRLVDNLESQFVKMFGYQPLGIRHWTSKLITAGPIEESEGAPNVKR